MKDIKLNLKRIKCDIKSESGSTIVIALVVILILVALAMAVVTMSVGNVRLSSASREMNFSTDLQELVGQYYLTEIDEALKVSEEQSQKYFRNSYFSLKEGDLINANIISTSATTIVTEPAKLATLTAEEQVVKDLLASGLHKHMSAEWQSTVYDPSKISQVNQDGKWVERINNHTGSTLFDTYYKENFKHVYKYLAYKNLNQLVTKIANGDKKASLVAFVSSNKSLTEKDYITSLIMPPLSMTQGSLNKENFDRLIELKTLDTTSINQLKSGFNEMKLSFVVDVSAGKKLNAVIKVNAPSTESIEQRTKRAVYGNPIWGNAITAKGTITFDTGSRCTIQGDLFSGVTDSNMDSVVLNNAQVNVEGNIYSRGNVKLRGSGTTGSQLEIGKRQAGKKIGSKNAEPEGAVLNKMKIYDGKGYFLKLSNRNAFGYDKTQDTDSFRASVGNLIQTQGEIDEAGEGSVAKETKLPFVLKDSLGGNIYARGLVIDESAKNAEATVNGNIVFLDDIVNKSAQSSTINLNGYVIGLDAMGLDISTFGQDLQSLYGIDKSNDGSCIKNYNGKQSNAIRINSPMMFVPGSAIVQGGYNTGTGVVDFTGDAKFLSPYKFFEDIAAEDNDNTPLADRKKTLNVNGLSIDLGEAEATKKTFIENNNIDGFLRTGIADTNITVNLTSNQKNSYIKGTTIMKVGNDSDYKIGSNFMHVLNPSNPTNYFNTYNALYEKYSEKLGQDDSLAESLKQMYYYEYLYRIFKSKTQYLGLWEINDINNLVNKNSIINPSDGSFRGASETGITVKKSTNTQPEDFDLSDIDASSGPDIYGTNEGKVVRGVIFADSNIELSASELTTFRGVIIANGNVTIKDNLRIIYDESVIEGLFTPSNGGGTTASLKHVYAADFFQPGETGTKLFTQERVTKSARGRKLVVSHRLTLEKWVIKR